MGDTGYPKLCMGTFISLVFAAKNRRTGIRSTYNGANDGLSNPDVFAALINAIDPGFARPEKGDAFKVITSNIKNCTKKGSAYYSPASLKLTLNDRMKDEYSDLKADVKAFVDANMDTDGCKKSFPSAVVCLLQQDVDGDPEDVFYISQNKGIKRRDITDFSTHSFEEIIIAVCHYILNNVADNTIGRSTISQWKKTYGDEERVLLDSLAKQVKLQFKEPGPKTMPATIGQMKLSDISEDALRRGREYLNTLLATPIEKGKQYFKKAYKHFSTVRTLLYNEEAKPLYDFFVCNTIQKRVPAKRGSYYLQNVYDATIPKLILSSKNIILTAVGGMGKA